MPKNYRSKTLNKDKTKHTNIKYPKKNKSGKNEGCGEKFKLKKYFKRNEPSNNDKDLDSITNLIANIDVKEKLHPFKIDVTAKNIKLKNEPNLSEEIINNLKLEPILLKKFFNKEDIIINTNNIIDNTGGGDCWFKTISLALYKDEEYHLTIKKKFMKV